MEKELVTIEFRYAKILPDYSDGGYRAGQPSKTITIGVFDTYEEACEEANKALLVFEKHFKLKNKKDRFGRGLDAFGSDKRLVTDLTYLTTPFSFFAKIQKLKYENVEDTILEVLTDVKKAKEFDKD